MPQALAVYPALLFHFVNSRLKPNPLRKYPFQRAKQEQRSCFVPYHDASSLQRQDLNSWDLSPEWVPPSVLLPLKRTAQRGSGA